VRRGVGAALGVFAVWAGPADACSIQADRLQGAEPLVVTLAAADCAGTTFHWTVDGAPVEGQTFQTTLRRGTHAVLLTTDEGTFRLQPIVVYGVVLARPAKVVGYGRIVRFQGKAVPPGAGRVSVNGTTARSLGGGVFRVAVRVTSSGPFVARYKGARSEPVDLLVRPKLEARVVGSAAVGSKLALRVRLSPARAGRIRVRIGGRVRSVRGIATIALGTARARTYRIVVTTAPAPGFTAVRSALTVPVVEPQLAYGSRGPAVRALEQALAAEHYALQTVDDVYGEDTVEAVLAFEKVHGLERTGRVDPPLWHVIERAYIPAARYAGDHVEVDKARQVLFVVRGGRAALVVHVSTGATGNTPLGLWHVYRKVAGYSWVLYYPSYFLRGFAIHGYPFVPAYPASHGCVRVPMWIAVRLYAQIPPGSSVYVY
jgi:peptidoglycan hydrolase-like protein with peptidoglycan-binding domain